MTVTTITDAELTPKDYASDQEVRWCAGCGDYAILKAVQKVLAELGAPRERTVFVSGIGCAARFPYYLSTYGFHTIHGRAPAIATGVMYVVAMRTASIATSKQSTAVAAAITASGASPFRPCTA